MPVQDSFPSRKMPSPSNLDAAQRGAVIIRPPDLPPSRSEGLTHVFLAGPTSSKDNPDWRTRLCTALADLPLAFLDPRNMSWDNTWREDKSDARWVGQVDWEMKRREKADATIFFFEAGSDAPISLLELGMSLGLYQQEKYVYVAKDYSKRGNVEAACERYGVRVWGSEEAFLDALRKTLQ